MDIHKGLGNANKIMNRLLFDGFDFNAHSSIHGGAYAMRFREKVCMKVIIASVYDEALF
jgi:dipeptidase D